MSESTARSDRWVGIAAKAWGTIGLVVLGIGLFWLLGRLGAVITPLVLALVIVFFLKSPVNWMVSLGLNRTLAVFIAYLVGIAVLAVFSTVVVPAIASRVQDFTESFPVYYDKAYEIWRDVQSEYDALTVPTWIEDGLDQAQAEVLTQATEFSRRTATGIFAAGGQAVGFFFNLIMSAVIAFYLLKDLPRLREGALSLLPERRQEEARHLYATVVGAIGGYIRGQLIVAAIVGVLAYIVLLVMGVPFPLVIGLLTGVFNVVPYLGAFIGAAVAAVAAAFVDPWLALWAVLALFAVQQVEGLLISPRVMSEQVDLHPVMVILSLLAGGALLGFVGLLVAIPVAAASKGVLVYYLQKHGQWNPKPRAKPLKAPWSRRRSGSVDDAAGPDGPDDQTENEKE